MAVLARLWRLRSRRPYFVGLTVLVLASIAAWPIVDVFLRSAEISTAFRYYDFGAYHNAVIDWEAGDPIYQPNEDGGYHGNYLYPPIAVPIFAFFLSTFEKPALVWGLVSVLFLWISLQLAIHEFGVRLHLLERGLLLWLLVGFQPLLFGFKMGQVSTFLAGVLTIALVTLMWDLKGGKRSASWALCSGICTTLGSSVKLIYATSGAHLLRSPRRLGGALIALFTLLGLSLLLFDPATHRGYLDVLLWGKDWGTGSRSPHLWLPAYFRPWLVVEFAGMAIRLVIIVATIALALIASGPKAELPTFALGVAIIPLAAPRSYTFDFVVLLPVVVVLLAIELDRDGYPWVPVLGLFFLHVHAYGLYVFGKFYTEVVTTGAVRAALPLLQPGLWGSLLLAGLAFGRVAERTRLPELLREQWQTWIE